MKNRDKMNFDGNAPQNRESELSECQGESLGLRFAKRKVTDLKDSGIPWIGEIPKDWCLIRIKNVASFLNGFAFNSDTFKLESEIPVIRIGDIGTPLDYDSCVKVKRDENLSSYLIRQDDILIAMSGATTGKSCIITQHNEAYINQRVGIIRSDMGKYILYAIQSPSFFEYVSLNSTGSAQPNISATEIGNFFIPFSNDKEQKKIAEFLDRKCGEIDELVALQDKMIEELKAYKQSIITETVTKGLNPNVPLKDRGIEWIGEIPQHWKVLKMNQLCNVITDYVASGSFADLKSNVQYLDSPDFAMLVRTADLSQKNSNIKRVYVSKESYAFLNNSNLFGGEIVLPNIGASIGDVYIVPKDLYKNMTLAPNSIMIKSKYSNLYLYYYFSSSTGRESILQLGDSTAQGKFNKTDLRALRVPIPSLSEQQEIADFLDKKCSEIDSLIDLKQQKIEELKDYKKSIIYEYVTGKKSVGI